MFESCYYNNNYEVAIDTEEIDFDMVSRGTQYNHSGILCNYAIIVTREYKNNSMRNCVMRKCVMSK